MLDVLRKEVIDDRLDAHITNSFNTYAAADNPSMSWLTSSSFMAPVAIFDWRRSDTARSNKKYGSASKSKKLMDIVELYKDGNKSLLSHSEAGSEEPPRRGLSKRCSEHLHSKFKNKDINGIRPHWSSQKKSTTPVQKTSAQCTSGITAAVEYMTPGRTEMLGPSLRENYTPPGQGAAGYHPRGCSLLGIVKF